MPSAVGLLDLAIVAVPALGLGLWQLIAINRTIARDRAERDSPRDAGHAIGEHRLDDR